jgi:archaellum biogenesis ATPase FlaH
VRATKRIITLLERKLVGAALQSRAAFEALAGSEEVGHFDPALLALYMAASSFYQQDPAAESVDVDILAASLAGSKLNPRKGRELAELVRTLAGEEVSVENIRGYLLAQGQERKGMALASAIAGRRPEEEIREALEGYTASLAAPVAAVDDAPQWGDALRSRIDRSNRLTVSPKALNEHLSGGVCPGHNLTIFGRPEAGKTALAITMACGFARRGLKVLYIGNEDPIQDLMVRVVSNLTDATVEEIAADPDHFEREALKKGASHMVMRATSPGSIREIEALIKQHKPDVLFVDQLRNINSGKSDNFTQLLDKNAQAVRALGKRYGLVTISVTQAGDSASGRAILDMGDVDSSNTGIPGAADVMIGVGVTEALDRSGQRMLSLCKNKLGTHAQVLVSLDPFRSKIK